MSIGLSAAYQLLHDVPPRSGLQLQVLDQVVLHTGRGRRRERLVQQERHGGVP